MDGDEKPGGETPGAITGKDPHMTTTNDAAARTLAAVKAEQRALYARWTTNGKFDRTADLDGYRSTSDVRASVKTAYAALKREEEAIVAAGR